MPRTVAFLRALNVGGHTVTMETLRTHFESLGLDEVETFIASGNVIFRSPAKGASTLARRIEAHLEKSLGYEVATFLRTDAEVAAIARHQPFPTAQLRRTTALVVAFLAEPLSDAQVATLMGLKSEIDDFHVNGREVYWACVRKQSDSRFSNAVFERALQVKTTFRGVSTVVRLSAKVPPTAGG